MSLVCARCPTFVFALIFSYSISLSSSFPIILFLLTREWLHLQSLGINCVGPLINSIIVVWHRVITRSNSAHTFHLPLPAVSNVFRDQVILNIVMEQLSNQVSSPVFAFRVSIVLLEYLTLIYSTLLKRLKVTLSHLIWHLRLLETFIPFLTFW